MIEGGADMVIVYSTPTCPKCNVIKSKLKSKNIEYVENQDIDVMTAKGITNVPYLEVDGVLMDFSTANNWINQI